MLPSARLLLESSLDYAGTFPPAGLPMADAVRAYARARHGPHRWMLGRLVVGATSLAGFERDVAEAGERPPVRWEVSVVLRSPPSRPLDEIGGFLEHGIAGARVASIEFPPLEPDDIRAARAGVPASVECFFEIPADAALEHRLEEVGRAGGHAKVRTGGVAASAFPPPEALAGFMKACAAAGLAFKATAGLHHAVRGGYRLTSDAAGETASMYGFLNVALAAALVRTGGQPRQVADALVETSAAAVRFEEDGVRWRDQFVPNETLAETRRRLFRSFGSCSFDEPVEELRALRLL